MVDIPEREDGLLAFDSKHKTEWFELYKQSANFKGSLSCTSAFNDYETNRIKDLSGFNAIKAPDGKSITEKLTANATVNAALGQALQSESLDKARDKFSKELTALNQLISSPKPEFSPGEVGSYLLSIRNDVVDAIKAQHAKAKDELNQAFDNNQAFKDSLKTALNLNDAQLTAIRGEMIAAFDKSMAEELAKTEKAIEDNANQLFKAARDELHRIVYLADRYHRNKRMRDEIKTQINANPGEEGSTLECNGIPSDRFKNVDVAKLSRADDILYKDISSDFFDSILNRKINKNPDGSLSVKMSRFDSDGTIRIVAASLVQEQLAKGNEVITLTINNKDPKRAEHDARLAYEGAIVAGADPKKIIIKVNGEEKFKYDDKGNLEKNELFKEDGARLQFAQDKGKRLAGKVDSMTKGTASSNNAIKQRLQDIVQQQPVQNANVQDDNQQDLGIAAH